MPELQSLCTPVFLCSALSQPATFWSIRFYLQGGSFRIVVFQKQEGVMMDIVSQYDSATLLLWIFAT